eukprot:5139010-Prorocentrum_lima.AAC.1
MQAPAQVPRGGTRFNTSQNQDVVVGWGSVDPASPFARQARMMDDPLFKEPPSMEELDALAAALPP